MGIEDSFRRTLFVFNVMMAMDFWQQALAKQPPYLDVVADPDAGRPRYRAMGPRHHTDSRAPTDAARHWTGGSVAGSSNARLLGCIASAA